MASSHLIWLMWLNCSTQLTNDELCLMIEPSQTSLPSSLTNIPCHAFAGHQLNCHCFLLDCWTTHLDHLAIARHRHWDLNPSDATFACLAFDHCPYTVDYCYGCIYYGPFIIQEVQQTLLGIFYYFDLMCCNSYLIL